MSQTQRQVPTDDKSGQKKKLTEVKNVDVSSVMGEIDAVLNAAKKEQKQKPKEKTGCCGCC